MQDGAVLIIQHQALGQPGTILETLIHDGIHFDLRQLHGRAELPSPDDLDRYRALIVLGGSMNTDQGDVYPFLHQERLLLAAALERELPLLGICLGAQQLACVNGGCVFDRAEPAVGWMPIRARGAGPSLRGGAGGVHGAGVARAVVHRSGPRVPAGRS